MQTSKPRAGCGGGITRRVVLSTAKVESPSDYKGVLFVEFDDAGAWRMELAKEMKAAGLEIDMHPAVSRAGS